MPWPLLLYIICVVMIMHVCVCVCVVCVCDYHSSVIPKTAHWERDINKHTDGEREREREREIMKMKDDWVSPPNSKISVYWVTIADKLLYTVGAKRERERERERNTRILKVSKISLKTLLHGIYRSTTPCYSKRWKCKAYHYYNWISGCLESL